MSKVQTKVEHVKASEKICLDADNKTWRSGFLVTAFTQENGGPLNLLSAKFFSEKPGKKKVAQVKKEGEAIIMKESFAGKMAEILDMIDEENRRFK